MGPETHRGGQGRAEADHVPERRPRRIRTEARPGPPVRGSQGTTLATWDLGGDGPPLLVLHATGFHGRCYAPLAAEMADRFQCWALDQRGHGSSDAAPDGDYDWRYFTADALAAVERLGLERPFVFGHSLGGAVALLAEEQQHGTFAGFYLFEPIVLSPAMRSAAERNHSLSDLARRRRPGFASMADALINFAGKQPFSRFRADALLAYVEGGFGETAGGAVALRCGTEAEARVYEGAPRSGAFGHLGEVAAPVTLACGQRNPDVSPAHLHEIAARLPQPTIEEHAGLSHFGPFEDPVRVAGAVTGALSTPPTSA